jgi:hypothetical protein
MWAFPRYIHYFSLRGHHAQPQRRLPRVHDWPYRPSRKPAEQGRKCRHHADETLHHRPARRTTGKHGNSSEPWTVQHNRTSVATAQHRFLTTQNPVLREGGEGSIPSFGTILLQRFPFGPSETRAAAVASQRAHAGLPADICRHVRSVRLCVAPEMLARSIDDPAVDRSAPRDRSPVRFRIAARGYIQSSAPGAHAAGQDASCRPMSAQ